MQDDLFNDRFAVYKKLMDVEFCKQLTKHGMDFMSDYYRMEFEEEHLKIAEGIVKTDERNRKHRMIDIYVTDPILLKIWKLCVSRVMVMSKNRIWKEAMDRKLFKDDENHKYLFSLVYDKTNSLYGWGE